MKLDWTQKDTAFIRTHFKEVDLIFAADVIYDSSLFDALLSTIRLLFDCCDNCNKFMLVNAVRNPETEQEFLRKLGKIRSNSGDGKPVKNNSKNNNENLRVSISDAFGLQYREEQSIQPKLLYWQPNEFSPIKLYTIFNK